MMEYKGYIGKVEFDADAKLFHGEVVGIRDVVTFQGQSVKQLEKAFRDSVNDYLDFCAARHETPERSYSGQFVVRVEPELHRRLSVAAAAEGKSLNSWIVESLATHVSGSKHSKRPRRGRNGARSRAA